MQKMLDQKYNPKQMLNFAINITDNHRDGLFLPVMYNSASGIETGIWIPGIFRVYGIGIGIEWKAKITWWNRNRNWIESSYIQRWHWNQNWIEGFGPELELNRNRLLPELQITAWFYTAMRFCWRCKYKLRQHSGYAMVDESQRGFFVSSEVGKKW